MLVSKMTPSQQAKAAGLPSLAAVSRITGVSVRTLINWHEHKPQLFGVVLLGAKQQLEQQNDDSRRQNQALCENQACSEQD